MTSASTDTDESGSQHEFGEGHGWRGVLRLLMQWGTGILLAAVIAAQLSPLLWIGTVTEAIAIHCAVALAVCMIYFRREALWSGAIVVGILLACWPTVWQAYARRAPSLPAEPDRPLTIASANVMWTNPRMEDVAKRLLEMDVEVLVVHEPITDLVGRIRKHGRYPYVYDASDDQAYGMALFSRYPLKDVDHHLIEVDKLDTRREVQLHHHTQVRVLSATIHRRDGFPVRLICAHPPSPLWPRLDAVRAAVFKRLGEAPAAIDLPLVMAADLNLTASSHRWRELHAAGWRRGPGHHPNTWLDTRLPDGLWPLLGLRIDHLLVGPGLAIGDERTVRIPGSDHAAIVGTIALRGDVAATAPIVP